MNHSPRSGHMRVRSALLRFWPAVCLLLVSAPLTALPPKADELWKIYAFGSEWSLAPLRVLVFPFATMWQSLVGSGNFRPLGRIIEHANYLLAHWLITILGLPLNVALGVIRTASLLVLLWALRRLSNLLTGHSQTAGGPAWMSLALPLGFVCLVVNAGGLNPLGSFSGLYLQSAALALTAIAFFSRPSLAVAQRARALELAAYALLGVALASTNEILYLAVPAMCVSYLTMALSGGRGLKGLWGLKGTGLLAATLGGFAAIFIPVRILIRMFNTEAYAPSAINIGGVTADALARRLFSGLPFYAWSKFSALEAALGRNRGVLAAVCVVALLAVVVAFDQLRHSSHESSSAPELSDPVARGEEHRTSVGRAVAVGATIVVFSALLSTLSVAMQTRDAQVLLLPWKESPLAWAGWGLIFSACLGWLMTRPRWSLASGIVIALSGALAVTMTFSVNQSLALSFLEDSRSLADVRLASELANFDLTDQGDQHRCAIRAEHAAAYDAVPQLHQRIFDSVDAFTSRVYDQPFCSQPPTSSVTRE